MIGEVLKPQGVRGEVKVRPDTSDPARFENLSRVFLAREGAYVPREVESSRLSGDMAYLKLAGVDDRGVQKSCAANFCILTGKTLWNWARTKISSWI